MAEEQVPAGWYPYEEEGERYWDGDQWTDESRPTESSDGPQPVATSEGPQPVEEGGAGIEYKVLTQKDRFFGGKFDPQRLESALNAYAAERWAVIGIATADIHSWGGARQELVVVMSRSHDA
ncbi:MAG TPA: DUF4177 domain-containing protein [Solirubrobacterales bacterium]|nr:DUF4177 domain-containing protein [Solirubrobacterales bacterium]